MGKEVLMPVPEPPVSVPESNAITVTKGFAFIISHETFLVSEGLNKDKADKLRRDGNKIDEDSLEELLKYLKFDYRFAREKTKEQLEREMKSLFEKELYNLPEFKDEPRPKPGLHDCVLVVVMTHGLSGGLLFDHANKEYSVSDVLGPFVTGRRCADVPLIFVFQACRGKTSDEGRVVPSLNATSSTVPAENAEGSAATACGAQQPVNNPATPDQKDEQKKEAKLDLNLILPNKPNVLICYSTVEDHVSWRTTDNGTFFISNLCKELRTGVDQGRHLLTMLTRTHRAVAEKDIKDSHGKVYKQAPAFTSYLTRKIFFEHKLETLV